MKKCHFLEGFIIGIVTGIVGWMFLKNTVDLDDIAPEFESSKGPEIEPEDESSTEDLVEKTLSAIETGFDRLSDMVKEKKED